MSPRRSSFMAAWKRTGLRSGAGLSRGLLYLFYWTLLMPFGLIARWSKPRANLSNEPGAKRSNSGIRSQY